MRKGTGESLCHALEESAAAHDDVVSALRALLVRQHLVRVRVRVRVGVKVGVRAQV